MPTPELAPRLQPPAPPTDDIVIIPEGFPLREEYETYMARKEELLAHEGQFVLIKGREVLGIFPTMAAALDAGSARFPLQAFMAHRIVAVEPVVNAGRVTA